MTLTAMIGNEHKVKINGNTIQATGVAHWRLISFLFQLSKGARGHLGVKPATHNELIYNGPA